MLAGLQVVHDTRYSIREFRYSADRDGVDRGRPHGIHWKVAVNQADAGVQGSRFGASGAVTI